MKKISLLIILAVLMLASCGNDNSNNTAESSETSVQTELTEVSESIENTTVSETEEVTEKAEEEPLPPLSHSARQAYYEDDDFSVTAELVKLQSSLYYPDIVAKIGADPEMFVSEITVKVKNITHEDKSFDFSKLTLMSDDNALYMFMGEDQDDIVIASGKNSSFRIKALCTLGQAEAISGMAFDGVGFEVGERFIPDKFADIIDIQSADDVSEYLYKTYFYRADDTHYMFPYSEPAAIEAHLLGRVGENKEYFAVEYTVTNRSDYALIIDPKTYAMNLHSEDSVSGSDGYAVQAAVSAKDKLMYEPVEIGKLKGIGKLYEIPDFICMEPDGSTKFIMIYEAPSHITGWVMQCLGKHDEHCYAQYESAIAKECDY